MSDPEKDPVDPSAPEGAAPDAAVPAEAPRDPAGEPAWAGPGDDGAAPEGPDDGAADDAPDDDAYQAASRPSPLGYVFLAGVAGLLIGVAWRLIEPETGAATAIWIFVSALMALAPLPWHAVDWFHAAATRRGGAFASVVVTVTLGCVVMLFVSAMNVVVKEHPDRMPEWLRHRALDTTESGRYSLGEETLKVLARLEGEGGGTVFATYLRRAGEGSQTGEELRQMALEQLRVYGYRSPRVQVEDFDSFREPEATRRALAQRGVTTLSSAEDKDVIVLSWADPGREATPGKQKEIAVDQYEFAKPGGQGAGPRWLGERVITSAIQELAFVRLKAYVVGGHGGRSLTDEMREIRERLRSQNVDVVDRPIDLTGGADVPKDCDLLLVLDPDPRSPFDPAETASLARWLDTGRSLFVCLDVHANATKRESGLEPLLAAYGIVPKPQYVVVAPVARPIVGGGAVLDMLTQFVTRRPDYASHPAVEALRRGNGFPGFFSESMHLDVKTDLPEGVTADVLVWAPEVASRDAPKPHAALISASRRDYTAADPATDVTGIRLPLVACATKSLPADAGGVKRDARVFVSGDTDVFTDQLIRQCAPNLDLFGGATQWSFRRADLAAVSDKTLDIEIASIGEHEHRMAFGWPLVTALVALLAGAGVWWSRRR